MEEIVRLKNQLRDVELAAKKELEELQLANKKLEELQLAAKKELEDVRTEANRRIDEANARAASASALLEAGAAVHRPAPPRPPQQLSVVKGLGFCVTSPSKGSGVFLQENLVSLTMNAKPHLDSLRSLSCEASLQLLADDSPASLLSEENLYEFATKFTPEWVTATSRSTTSVGTKSAKTLFCGKAAPPVLPNFQALPWSCMPELLTSSQIFHPGFNVEVKSAISRGEQTPKMFDELLTYVFLGTAASLFGNVPAGHRRFFSYPPVGFGLAAFPHVGYLVAVEWIG
jgi:hypothetical protein